MKNLLKCTIWGILPVVFLLISGANFVAGGPSLHEKIDQLVSEIDGKVIEWRRDIHENPELSNREFKTAEKIAAHLKSLGMEVQTGIAHTGVVGILKGGKPGPVVALRADIDALPVTENTGLAFASTVKADFNGQEVGVMHACGHDAHTAILMGAAEVLTSIKADLKGTVKFIFQPCEEGAPKGEEGGAELMVKEGVLSNPKPDAIFGLHVKKELNVGQIGYRPGGIMAATDRFTIKVKGKQTHGSTPWTGVDPIVTASQIIMGLQTIVSRETPLVNDAAVVTVGSIHGGLRFNIIPSEVELIGTVRTLNDATQDRIHEAIRLKATKIAESNGATAEVVIEKMCPVTYNDPAVTGQMVSSLQDAAGAENVNQIKAIMGGEDFAYYQKEIPGLYYFVGVTPVGKDAGAAPPHHTPEFFIDESGLQLGVKSLCYLVVDYK